MSLNETFDRLLPLVEADLRDIVRAPHRSLGAYYGMMSYHLGWLDERLQPIQTNSGKRLRPIACLLSSEAAGGDAEQALPAASAVELVHNFSLVHDDIQDTSHFRRGRRAVWDIWGTPQGINVGDGLFVLARLALHRLLDRGVAPRRQQAAALALDRACLSLCEGQFFDLSFEDRIDVDLEQYTLMIHHKTAALLAASAQLGAIVATDDEEQIERFYCFGENLGLAFQVQDDILGIWGDEGLTGKSAATDIQTKKKVLPVVYALNQPEDPSAAQELATLYARQGALDARATQRVLALLERVGARQYAVQMAARYYQQALENLAQQLRELAASLVGREA